jgi:hypothetical protein
VGGEQTYEAAGVSIAKADAVVERLRAAVESTGAGGFGAFAGLYPLDDDRLPSSRASAARCASAAPTSLRTASTTSPLAVRTRSSSSTT